MSKETSYRKLLKEHNKARKKFIKSLRNDAKIQDDKLMVFTEYDFPKNEIRNIFENVFPNCVYITSVKSHYNLILTIFFENLGGGRNEIVR